MTPEAYCEERTRASGSSFYYAFVFLPKLQRRAMMALYAFCREVDDVADEIKDKDVAMKKIAFWQQEIVAAFQGKAHHPVTQELMWSLEHFQFSEELFHEILDGMVMDISGKVIVKASDLHLYCYRVAGVVGLLSIEVFGYQQRKSRNFATALGEAMQLTNILRDVPEDILINRIYLPQTDRAKYHVTDQDIKTGNITPQLLALLEHYGQQSEQLFAQAIETLPEQDRVSLRPSIIMASIYYAHLQRLKKNKFNVWQHPVRLLPVHKLWIAWRCLRYEKKAERMASKGHHLPVRLLF
ncbi:MAG: squalene synthase HpnD [Zetaproteobacteria bacterium CG_4_9_14_3_um_filter_49_83]|nr:MAG: squalene synthase HpnD [Zetaproteobacteria bacterium CG1_02_49_23]PIQ33117.1 MAG: squalene synthase HpnD [Zetaproteobacteria bacterium CG17_big_fil_post_rev_8_21_14_2_50_50_13]PIV29159.1 MAG: squalene synthase HpnD [Zetaproteobacteria bacterium CG02_land_8_20_14_3_00_50_9]PIY55624.1 MAG: squalene synthase HpnD [Zetaproteobacteria bacterium CG_4_10_14_0_8_um_filter_49_80]PJA36432.1 MAG: squalene synthase HpnD [Zetaproteobacteria bacterium CG_4_9_14_3_um_filter_49_83]